MYLKDVEIGADGTTIVRTTGLWGIAHGLSTVWRLLQVVVKRYYVWE